MSKTHYDEPVEQLDVVLANKPLLEVMDKSLHNKSSQIDCKALLNAFHVADRMIDSATHELIPDPPERMFSEIANNDLCS